MTILLPTLTITAILAGYAGGFVWFLSACRGQVTS
ncbi:hypothetical protein J2850_000662 [Azospirillum picis]|uniref:Uncharacterized protein n=1 Tax=Azospirillum picis TaxID=488438 RepID=A0ABU0MF00_9PROT|nr:hypothetical protein [Azospirillum picis]MDQ0531826.1 hypothetical protein [Azospirillum picis]